MLLLPSVEISFCLKVLEEEILFWETLGASNAGLGDQLTGEGGFLPPSMALLGKGRIRSGIPDMQHA